MAINQTSSIKTPQAGDDTFYTTEDYLTNGEVMILDVMSNDLGGNAKTLWSIAGDDGNAMNLEDLSALLSADAQNVDGGSLWETTHYGNLIRIVDGKLEYKLGGTEATAAVNSLAAGEIMHDTFTYSIRLANGTLSLATVSVDIVGTNDAPTLAAVTDGSVAEVDQSSTTTDSNLTGILAGDDVDNGAILTYGIEGGTTISSGDFDV
jgi:VCBS repeat-containing protein